MSGISSIPFATDTILSLLQDNDQLADVAISDENKGAEALEFIWLLGTDGNWESPWAGLGPTGNRNESYSLTLYVSARCPGQTQADARNRVFEIYAQVERSIVEYVQSEQDKGPILMLAIQPTDYTPVPTNEGIAALIEAQIAVQARI